KRRETSAVAVGRILAIVVGPGKGPSVAALGLADNRFLRCPRNAGDDLAWRIRSGSGLLGAFGDRIEERLEKDLHALVVISSKHVTSVLGFRRERFAIADHNQIS